MNLIDKRDLTLDEARTNLGIIWNRLWNQGKESRNEFIETSIKTLNDLRGL